MKTKKMIAIMASVMMFGSVAAACGDSNKENKTPHTTYSADQIDNMSDDELEKALENAAKEIEASEKAEQEAPEEENEGIDFWEDVEVTFTGAENFCMVKAEYIGDNQIIKDNVELRAGTFIEGYENYVWENREYVNGYDKFIVSAWYDEEALKEQGIILKKRRYEEPQNGEYPKLDKSADFCFYTISGLGNSVDITDDTDTAPFAAAVETITERVYEKAQEDKFGAYDWVKNNEIYPTEFYLLKGSTGDGYISYSDKDGNFLSWVRAYDFNHFNEDGTWCQKEWLSLINDGIWCTDQIGLKEDSLVKVNID